MNLETLEKIIEMVRRHGIHQVEIEDAGLKISVTASAPMAAGMMHAPQQAMYPGLGATHLGAHYPQAQAAPPPSGAAPAPAEPAKKVHLGRVVKSPFVGTFYRSSSPGADVFCEIGKRVKKGDTLCIIEAMKLMNEIEVEFDGVIKEILVDNEQPVEFDQPLFLME